MQREERAAWNYKEHDKNIMTEEDSITERANLSMHKPVNEHAQKSLGALLSTITATTNPHEEKYLMFSKYNTTCGNIYKHGIGRMGNLLFQMASTLGLAVSLSRKPVFSSTFEHLVSIFPNVQHLNFMPADKFSLKFHNPAENPHTKKIVEENYGIYSEEKFLLANHSEKNIEVGFFLMSYRYFQHIDHDIRSLFRFGDDLEEDAKHILHTLLLSNTSLPHQQGKVPIIVT